MGFDTDKGHNGKKIDINAPTVENRGHLYMWMREVIAITKPKMFIAENVKGLTNLNVQRNNRKLIFLQFVMVDI